MLYSKKLAHKGTLKPINKKFTLIKRMQVGICFSGNE
jgi:hypothetical protein